MKTQSFTELAQTILSLQSKRQQKLIGIDGGGGAGKSTFAEHLQKNLPKSVVVHVDDFYIGPWDKRLDHKNYVVNPLFDWNRFTAEVLEPIQKGEAICYHVYDWHTHTAEQVVSVPQDAIVIVEGGYTTQKDFTDVYDYKIWIEADMDLRLEKALARDGEHMRFLWEEDWLPVERNYIAKDYPASRADLVVKGHMTDFSKGFFAVVS